MEIIRGEVVKCSGEFDEDQFLDLLADLETSAVITVQCPGSEWADSAEQAANADGRVTSQHLRTEPITVRLPDGGYVVQDTEVVTVMVTPYVPMVIVPEPEPEPEPEVDPNAPGPYPENPETPPWLENQFSV